MAKDPQIRTIIRALERLTERVIKKITLDTTANLIETTPKDTGWATANWVPNIGVPFEDTSGTREEAEAGSIKSSDQQSGIALVATAYTLKSGRVFITNNVPYITLLNEGSSQKAPSGFVQAAINKAVTQDILSL